MLRTDTKRIAELFTEVERAYNPQVAQTFRELLAKHPSDVFIPEHMLQRVLTHQFPSLKDAIDKTLTAKFNT